MKTSTILSVLFLFVTMTATHAAIVITDEGFFFDGPTITPATGGGVRTISAFEVAAGGKIVVTTAMENADISGVTFDGQAFTPVYSTGNGVQRITTYYLDVVSATTADILVTPTAGTTTGIGAVSFTGAALGGPADFASSATKSSGSFNTENGSLVVGSFTINSAGTIVPSTASTNLYYEQFIGNGGTTGSSDYYFSTVTGTESYGFTSNSSTRPVAGAVVFNVIPEPSSIALLGLAGLSLVLFSRRRR